MSDWLISENLRLDLQIYIHFRSQSEIYALTSKYTNEYIYMYERYTPHPKASVKHNTK